MTRSPVPPQTPLYSNYYTLDAAYVVPTSNQCARIGKVMSNILAFKQLVDREQIKPMLLGVRPRALLLISHCANRIPRASLPNNTCGYCFVARACQGLVPLCMEQYKRMFSTTRIPGRETDVLKHWDSSYSRHFVVLYHGHYYKMDVYRPKTVGVAKNNTPPAVPHQGAQLTALVFWFWWLPSEWQRPHGS